nr:hypothetical protein [Tanacetum cinerariifolium]
MPAGFQENMSRLHLNQVIAEGYASDPETIVHLSLPMIPLHGDGNLTTIKLIHVFLLLPCRKCFFRTWLEAATSPLRNVVVTLTISSTDFGILSCRRLMSLSLESLHKVLYRFPLSLLDVCPSTLSLLSESGSIIREDVPHGNASSELAPFFLTRNFGDFDLSRLILEKTLWFGSGLLDMQFERPDLSLLLRSLLMFGVMDSECCDTSWIFKFLPEQTSKLR